MWLEDYGLHSTGDSFSGMLPGFMSDDDFDADGWFDDLEEMGDIELVKIEYANGTEQEIHGGEYGLPEKAEELYITLSEYFEPEEAEWE